MWFDTFYQIALENYSQNRHILASCTEGEYTTVIVGLGNVKFPGTNELCAVEIKGIELHFRGNDGPWPQGRWMDWPEPHWNVTESQYAKLPIEIRAKMEAQEQVRYWIPQEFDSIKNKWKFHAISTT